MKIHPESFSARPALWKRGFKALNANRALYLLLLPGLLYFTIFKYLPMAGIIVAFKDFNLGQGIWHSDWIGFENFRIFIEGVYFWQILGNTIIISLYKLLLGFPAPIILALLLNEIQASWYKKFVQTVTYMPHFLSWVIVYGMMVALLSPGDGLINQWIKDSGFQPISFLSEPQWARFLVVASEIWKDLGWGAIIYLAALAGIDPSLYEAARMDGASRWRQLWHVTLPGIRTVMILMLIMKLGHILDAGFEQIFMLANAFNQEKIDIIDTWVYRAGLERMEVGLATAVGLFKSIIGFIMVILANRIAKKFEAEIW
ncbi:ABC transporter permease [Paenibacillus sp. FSL H7-0714]|uniref:ABC transporter permease n=1 Tax=Paenibacillus sp. FSL H7-0714 TaxID=2954735 RepID=UPI0030FC67EA